MKTTHQRALLSISWLLLAACASPPSPEPEVAVSAAAVSSALNAGAAEAAPVEMSSAREKLAQARAAMASEDFDRARMLANEAQADAVLAESKARAAKAGKAADELREGRRVLKEELDRKAK